MKSNLALKIKCKAQAFGYVACGITDASPFEEFVVELQKRMKVYPGSRHLYEKLVKNAYPKKRAEGAKSIIVCIRRYGKYRIPNELARYIGKSYLTDGRLANSTEYSLKRQFEKYLKELGLHTLRGAVTARWAAARSGVGGFARNNFIYVEKYGSWVIIDTWIVNKEMEYDDSLTDIVCPRHCTECIDACPTQALSGPLMMDYGKCIAYLTYGLSDLPSDSLKKQMGTWLYGCDICQNTCPLNAGSWQNETNFPRLNSLAKYVTLKRILKMDEKKYLEVIHPRFWYIGKDKLWMWKCNALRAMANSGNDIAKYEKDIKAAVEDDNEKVRHVANWAINKL